MKILSRALDEFISLLKYGSRLWKTRMWGRKRSKTLAKPLQNPLRTTVLYHTRHCRNASSLAAAGDS
jgi:hypothetical protein